ncbi:MAG: hypothetical protein RJA70_3985 [Pseudomonadota bacterium]|jgi:hypothetical protein
MFGRVGAIAWNSYREAVRARILHGLFALAVATSLYAIVVGKYTSKNSLRVISDVGGFSISVYAIVVAIVLGATSLYREVELKTLFPILARPIRRGEYLAGKYLGTLLTLGVFMAANAGVLLFCLAFLSAENPWLATGSLVGVTALVGVVGLLVSASRTALPLLWGLMLLATGYWLSDGAIDDRRVVLAAAALSLLEVCIITALANVFAAFSSPFLTAVFTFGVVLVGRSAETLASLPARMFGQVIHEIGGLLSQVVPNLMIYVPPRPLLTGETPEVLLSDYLVSAGLQSLGWSLGLLIVAGLVFQKRDFV